MSVDIFQLNWILIDCIIIILLIFLLVSVKIFKKTHRWRLSLSNNSLERIHCNESNIKFKNLNINVKDWSLTWNTAFKDKPLSKPIIVLFRTNKKKELLNILTEGLASYGLDVISLRVQFKLCSTSDILDINIQKEIREIISEILNSIEQRRNHSNLKYFVINYDKSKSWYNSLLTDINNVGLVLINPKLRSNNIRDLFGINNFKDLTSPFYIIFSKAH